MWCLPAWMERAAICLISRMFALHKPCRSELARELFAASLKSSRASSLLQVQLQPPACGAYRPGRRGLRSALSPACLHCTNPVGASLSRELFAASLKSSRDKLAPTGEVAASCMWYLPAWMERAAICLISRMFALHKPCRSELVSRALRGFVEKLARQARSYRCSCSLLPVVPTDLDGEGCDLPYLPHVCTAQTL